MMLNNINNIETLLVIGYSLILSYIVGIAGKYSARKSISDSDYFLTKPWKWVFEFVVASCSAALGYAAYALSAPFMLAGSAGILMVAIFSRFKKNNLNLWGHMIGAFGGFSLITTSFWVDLGGWYISLSIALITGLIWLITKSNKSLTWNVEIALIYSIFGGLLFYLLWLI